jgi:hypothetical protein
LNTPVTPTVFHTQLSCKNNLPTGEKSGLKVPLTTEKLMLRLLSQLELTMTSLVFNLLQEESHIQLLCKNNHPTSERSGQKVPLITLTEMLKLLIDSTLDQLDLHPVHKRNTHGLMMLMLLEPKTPSLKLRKLPVKNSEIKRNSRDLI